MSLLSTRALHHPRDGVTHMFTYTTIRVRVRVMVRVGVGPPVDWVYTPYSVYALLLRIYVYPLLFVDAGSNLIFSLYCYDALYSYECVCASESIGTKPNRYAYCCTTASTIVGAPEGRSEGHGGSGEHRLRPNQRRYHPPVRCHASLQRGVWCTAITSILAQPALHQSTPRYNSRIICTPFSSAAVKAGQYRLLCYYGAFPASACYPNSM